MGEGRGEGSSASEHLRADVEEPSPSPSPGVPGEGIRAHTVSTLRTYLRTRLQQPIVRPLALVGPIAVLLVALPLLRPLRHPSSVSPDEMLRLATIRALVDT